MKFYTKPSNYPDPVSLRFAPFVHSVLFVPFFRPANYWKWYNSRTIRAACLGYLRYAAIRALFFGSQPR